MNNNNNTNATSNFFDGWNFEKKELFEKIPDGNYRVLIRKAEKQLSQSGKKMIVLTLAISGYAKEIKHYIVFMPENPDMTNRSLTNLFEGFGIPFNNYNLNDYVGKAGVAKIGTNKDGYENIKYFITDVKEKDKLPEFKLVASLAKKSEYKKVDGANNTEEMTQAQIEEVIKDLF